MKLLPKWLTEWWKRIGEFVPMEEPEEEEYPYTACNSRARQHYGEHNDNWCPFCGYSGNADELRCHLLNHHSKCE